MPPETGGEQGPVLLVDDESTVLLASTMMLKSAGIRDVATLQESRLLLDHLARHPVAAVVLDLYMPHEPGWRLLPEIVQRHPEIPVIVMTAAHEVETAVASMKNGAFDYLVKPVEENRFISAVRRAVEFRSLRREVGELKRYLLTGELRHGDAFSHIVTGSRRMRGVFQYLEAISVSSEPVLVTGETGVGKELIAGAIHRLSGREGKLVALNVAGLDDTLFSDTLFGHQKGAYTGADQSRQGLITSAAGGTLFLDEIGELELNSQVKLLRLLQERTYYPLGADVPRSSDARVVCATNRDLKSFMSANRFRADLYFRLSVHRVEVPALRERPEDIPLLLGRFVEEAAASMNKEPPSSPVELLTLLSTYHFPGNVRELRAMVFDAVARHGSGRVLSMGSFREAMGIRRGGDPAPAPVEGAFPLTLAPAGRFPNLRETEQFLVEQAMARAEGNQGVAATLLGISRQALNQRLKKKPLIV
ncbi:MAG: sigma-54-dependent Fis family transcriptional regulator [Magnetococcales bacterium]|nr:sigma-54-dependent Fis family transcriptional regulator [Magnetococcales bacterium]